MHFLSVISIIMERHFNYLAALIENNEKIDRGIYGVWICDGGEWKLQVIDDFFPYDKEYDTPAFTYLKNEEIWINLIEKAYAKIYGSYEKINYGQPIDTFINLTGAPYEYIDVSYGLDELYIWNFLNENRGKFLNYIKKNKIESLNNVYKLLLIIIII